MTLEIRNQNRKNDNPKYMKKITLSLLLFIASFYLLDSCEAQYLYSVVKLSGGGDAKFRDAIAQRLTSIVNILPLKKWEQVKDYCTPEGLSSLKDLTEKTSCKNVNPLYETRLLNLPGGEYEVRDIKVKIDTHGEKGNPFQYLVFTLDSAGNVAGVRFAMEIERYQEIIKEGEVIQDFAFRQQILQFLEIYRTAYNRKDLDFLRQVFSDDALIIVGKVLQPNPNAPDYLERTNLTRENIQFIKLSKKQYLDSLEFKVFKKNAYISVGFDSIKIVRHNRMERIYGVTLYQHWKSQSYSDVGYLFLMVDFRKEDYPQIHVRSWQPERFADGSLMQLGNFDLIE
jgi:hypothetical protein